MTQKKMKKLKAPKPRNIPLLQHVQRGGAGAGSHKSGKAYRRREKHRGSYKPNPFQREGEAQPQAQFLELGVDRAYYDAVMTLLEDAEVGKLGKPIQIRFEQALTDEATVPALIRGLRAKVPAAETLMAGREAAFAAIVMDVFADQRGVSSEGAEPMWDEEQERMDLPQAFLTSASEDQVRALVEEVRKRRRLDIKVPAKATRDQLLAFLQGTKALEEIAQEVEALPKLRKEYQRVLGKRPPNKISVEELEAAIGEALAAEDAAAEEEEEEEALPRRGGMLGADLRRTAPVAEDEDESFDPSTFLGLGSVVEEEEEVEISPRRKKLGGARDRLVAQDQAATPRAHRLAGFTEQVAARRTPAGLGAPEGRPTDELLEAVSVARGILLYKLPTGETQVWIKPQRDARTARGWGGLTETFESRQGQASHFAAKAYVQAWRGVVGKNQIRADVRKSRPKTPVYLAVASDPTRMALILPPLVVDARGTVMAEDRNVGLDATATALAEG
jgi:hypothetical protein